MDAGAATFTFAADPKSSSIGRKHRHGKRHHRRSSRDGDLHDDDESLEYSASASSSAHSSLSSVGDSTDSSTFADIIRVLDLEDREDLKALMKKDSTKRGGGSSLGNAVTAGQDGLDQSLGALTFAPADPRNKNDILQKHSKDRTPKVKNGGRVRSSPTEIKHTIDPFDVTVKNK